jgi:hypothetical protein
MTSLEIEPATRYSLLATRYPLPATRYPLPATRYPLLHIPKGYYMYDLK